ncbi:hypothetical protein Efla_004142 [Eimeria flavescens]
MSASPDSERPEFNATWEHDDQEQQPTAIEAKRHLHYVEINEDGLVATFVGRGDYTDIGAVQADYPLPRNSFIAYYEVEILEAPSVRPSFCVGVSPCSPLLNRPPGVEPKSIGYRAEDGRKHCRKTKAVSSIGDPVAWEAYGPPFGQADIVGCGILNGSGEVFFTRNGTFVGHAGKAFASCDLFPTVSMRNTGESVKFNFAGPFHFNLRILLHRQLLEERLLIRQEAVDPAILLSLVRSYLLHAGFYNTLRSLNKAVADRQRRAEGYLDKERAASYSSKLGDSQAPSGDERQPSTHCCRGLLMLQEDEDSRRSSKEDYEAVLITWPSAVPRRLLQSSAKRAGESSILRAVMEGRVSNAINLLQFHFPSVLGPANANTGAVAKAMLFSQEVIECLRPPDRDVNSAVKCMQTRIVGLMAEAPTQIKKALCDCLGILAYDEPEEGPLGDVFDLSRRSLTARAVNKCILRKHLHVTTWSPLELLVRHLVACRQVLRFLGGSRGPLPSSREYCHPLPLRQTIPSLEAELL